MHRTCGSKKKKERRGEGEKRKEKMKRLANSAAIQVTIRLGSATLLLLSFLAGKAIRPPFRVRLDNKESSSNNDNYR